MVDTFNYFHLLISDSNFCLVDKNTIVNPPIMHMTLNWCFTRVLIYAIGFNRCFLISSFNLATLQQFFKKHQNRRYYHFKEPIKSIEKSQHMCYSNSNWWLCTLKTSWPVTWPLGKLGALQDRDFHITRRIVKAHSNIQIQQEVVLWPQVIHFQA